MAADCSPSLRGIEESLESEFLGASEENETHSIGLQSDAMRLYYGEIQAGTPGQSIVVLFATGIAKSWVPTYAGAVSNHSFFDPFNSSTLEATAEVFRDIYGSGIISGALVRDRVALGGLALDNFTFGLVNNTRGMRGYENLGFDGIFGLGFPHGNMKEGAVLMEALVSSGQLREPVFAFHLSGPPADAERGSAEEFGELVLGGVDPDHYTGDFNFLPLNSTDFWAVNLDTVSVGDALNMSWNVSAVVDSGTSILQGPWRDVQPIARALGARVVRGAYAVRCAGELPALRFGLGGQVYAMGKDDLVVERSGKWCRLALAPTAKPFWVLGTPFMQKYYVQFDWVQRRLGLALAKVNTTGQ